VKGEVGEAKVEGAEVAAEEGGGDRKSLRRGLANVRVLGEAWPMLSACGGF
jgi:hypothetical protein